MKRHSLRAIVLALLFATTLAAQTPTVDVISVKPTPHENNNGGIAMRADGLFVENAPLSFLLRMAFNQQFSDDLIVNMPPWADQHFDIAVKVSEGMPDLKSLDRGHYTGLRAKLLQQVLAERFHLQTHIEEREGPVFALVIAKGGLKIHPAASNPPQEYVTSDGRRVRLGLDVTNTSIAGHSVPIADLVRALRNSAHLDRVLIDRTGLTDNYDFVLNWMPDTTPQDNGAPATNFPSLFTAIQEQLGLKFEPAKGPVNTLVIDHVEKPSEN